LKALSAILAIAVLILWLGSLAYIIEPALPANSTAPIPTPPMGNIPPGFLGVLLFLLGIVVITFWAGMGPDKEDSDEIKNSGT